MLVADTIYVSQPSEIGLSLISPRTLKHEVQRIETKQTRHTPAGRRCLTRQCNGLCSRVSDGIYRHARSALGLAIYSSHQN